MAEQVDARVSTDVADPQSSWPTNLKLDNDNHKLKKRVRELEAATGNQANAARPRKSPPACEFARKTHGEWRKTFNDSGSVCSQTFRRWGSFGPFVLCAETEDLREGVCRVCRGGRKNVATDQGALTTAGLGGAPAVVAARRDVSTDTDDVKMWANKHELHFEYDALRKRVRELEARAVAGAATAAEAPSRAMPPLEVAPKDPDEIGGGILCTQKFRRRGSTEPFTLCRASEFLRAGVCRDCRGGRVNAKNDVCEGYHAASPFCKGFVKRGTQRRAHKSNRQFVKGAYCSDECAADAARILHEKRNSGTSYPAGFRSPFDD